MTTRFTAKGRENYGVAPLPTGYDGISQPTLTIPACGIEDVEAALFKLLDKEIGFQVGGNDSSDMKKVPIIFAAGEKWALAKNKRALRDRNGSLILPIITAIRTLISQSPSEDLTGRGINQKTGEIIVRRRLDKSDRSYQALVNRLLISNQQNLAVSSTTAAAGQLSTIREIGDLSTDPTVAIGGFLVPDRQNNVYETIVIPSPQFYTATFEITLWAQYTSHVNQVLEQLMSSFLPQQQGWVLTTPAGYWFNAFFSDEVLTPETNVDDMSDAERMIKYRFNIKVPAYLFASSAPGVPIPIKRYVSAPTVKFSVGPASSANELDTLNSVPDPFLGADDPTLPLADTNNGSRDLRRNGRTLLYNQNPDTIDPNDPALSRLPRGRKPARYQKVTTVVKGKQVVQYLRVASINQYTGETVFSSGTDLGQLNIVVIDD